MTQNNPTFKAAEIGKTFKDACIHFDALLKSAKSEDLKAISTKLHQELREYKQQGLLTVAFSSSKYLRILRNAA